MTAASTRCSRSVRRTSNWKCASRATTYGPGIKPPHFGGLRSGTSEPETLSNGLEVRRSPPRCRVRTESWFLIGVDPAPAYPPAGSGVNPTPLRYVEIGEGTRHLVGAPVPPDRQCGGSVGWPLGTRTSVPV